MFGIKTEDWLYYFIASIGCGFLYYMCAMLNEIRKIMEEELIRKQLGDNNAIQKR